MKALVVDDSAISRYVARMVLEADGWSVVEADCVEAALALIGGIDLCLVDVHLPDGTAADVCARLTGCATVLVSGDGDGLADLALALDVDGWHVKDADAPALQRTIAAALSRRAGRAAAAAPRCRR